MDATAVTEDWARVPDTIIQHCLALGSLNEDRQSAQLRLEEALGPELAHLLLAGLTADDRSLQEA